MDDVPDVTETIPRFWPAPVRRTGRSFEDVTGRHVVHVRHLPDPATLLRTRLAAGAGCETDLRDWRGFWLSTGLDVDALSASRAKVRAENRTWRERMAARTFADDPRIAARILHRLAAEPDMGAVRDEHLHVTEDALRIMAPFRAGIGFDAVVDANGVEPLVVVHRPGRPPRPLVAGHDDEDREAALARARGHLVASTPYWESGAFRRAAGRDMTVTEDGYHLSMCLFEMARAGHERAFLKSTASKVGTWTVDLHALEHVGDVDRMLALVLGPHAPTLWEGSGEAARTLVQEHVPFTCEVRFFVVGDRIVTGAPSDRNLGVADARKGRRLDGRVAVLDVPSGAVGAYDRGHTSNREDRRLVADMARRARTVVAELAREDVLPDTYCLDMGLTARGILPVEVNGFHHAGLYATDWDRVVEAVATRTPRPGTQVHGVRTHHVDDAVDFLLDVLADRPSEEALSVARKVAELAVSPEEARSLVRDVRHRREATRETPLFPVPGTSRDGTGSGETSVEGETE